MTPFDELVSLVARLRAPDGCPWDRAQSPESLRPYVVEEAYEVLEAIEGGRPEALREELGDLLFQVVLLSQMAQERGWFEVQEVARGITDKMVRRHPHVFDPQHVHGEEEGSVAAWEARKARERGAERSTLEGLPAALPALVRAHRVGEKVSRVGFDWPDVAGVRAKVSEELTELDEALASGDPAAIEHEYGDVLLALSNLGRFVGVGAEEALRAANRRFEGRFRAVEQLAAGRGLALHELDAQALDDLWEEVKRSRRGG